MIFQLMTQSNQTKLIIGLGNPGPKYSRTRHNAGFMVIDDLAKRLKVKMSDNPKLAATVGEAEGIILAKPDTFMNNSGIAVAKLLREFGLSAADILIVYDDVDTVAGLVRFRAAGRSGGHNGVKSIIETIGEDFPRLKIGVGKKEGEDTAEYVLKKLSPEELSDLKETVQAAVTRIVTQDFNK